MEKYPCKTLAYFSGIAAYSRDLMDRLPISGSIEPIAQTFARLKPALDLGKVGELHRLMALQRPTPEPLLDAQPAGMNTIGILADRLTILVCKEWYLRHRQRRAREADEIYHNQTTDIVTVLSTAQPGHAKLLEKVSSLPADATAQNFEEAYYGLLSANILMWETQELLYTRDMDALPPGELRDYIRFFSQANMMRNAFMTSCENWYWA